MTEEEQQDLSKAFNFGPPEETIVSMVEFCGVLMIATTRSLYRVKDPESKPEKIPLELR